MQLARQQLPTLVQVPTPPSHSTRSCTNQLQAVSVVARIPPSNQFCSTSGRQSQYQPRGSLSTPASSLQHLSDREVLPWPSSSSGCTGTKSPPEKSTVYQAVDDIVRFLNKGHDSALGSRAASCSGRIRDAIHVQQLAGHVQEASGLIAAVLLPCLLLKTMHMGDVAHMGSQLGEVLRDSMLIVKAANEASMDARSFIDWCLQTCSIPAALAAALFLHSGTRMPRAHAKLAALAQHLGLPSTPQAEAAQAAVPHLFAASASAAVTAPFSQPPLPASPWPASRRTSSSSRGTPCHAMPAGSAPITEQAERPLPVLDAATAAQQGMSIEALDEERVLAAGSSTTRTLAVTRLAMAAGDDEGDEADSGVPLLGPRRGAGGRQRSGLLARPQRTIQSDDEDGAADTPEPELGSSYSRQPVSMEEETAYEDGGQYDGDLEYDEDADYMAYSRRGERRRRPPPPPPERRVARATPMQLLPASEAYLLLDPETSLPLASDAPGLPLPLVGPFLVSNSVRAFPTTDALVAYDAGNKQIQDRLAFRLEYVAQRESDVVERQFAAAFGSPAYGRSGSEAAADGASAAAEDGSSEAPGAAPAQRPAPRALLQIYNHSRRVRGRMNDCVLRVQRLGGHEMRIMPGDKGVALEPGDTVIMGEGPYAPQFRVAVLAGGPASNAAILDHAVARYCTSAAAASSSSQPEGGRRARAPTAAQGGQRGGGSSQQSLHNMTLPAIARLVNTDPAAASQAYAAVLASRERSNAFAWIAWAQLAARLGKQRMARDLFRAAVAAAGPPLVTASTSHDPDAVSEEAADAYSQEQQQQAAAAGAWVALVQALFTWARFEWTFSKLWGAARHLWRASADAAMLHPAGPTAGGAGVVLHAWASAELAQSNVMNARVVVAEALRKCPDDQPLYVLAASVEYMGGEFELARGFCLRAYELDRTDKHLYAVWPRVMAAMGEKDKARVLFERALDYHPKNTKLMALYAGFEAERGDPEVARDLHLRALTVDPASETTMANRAAWANLEADLGYYDAARRVLAEGLELHPRHVPCLLALARVERLAGDLTAAQQAMWRASRLASNWDRDLLREKSKLLKTLGERDLAAALDAHLKAVSEMEALKKQGASTGRAWGVYVDASKAPGRRELARNALRRKQQLGWLERAGVPGARGAKNDGTQWRPLPARVQVTPRVPVLRRQLEEDDNEEEGQEGTADQQQHEGEGEEGEQPTVLGLGEDAGGSDLSAAADDYQVIEPPGSREVDAGHGPAPPMNGHAKRARARSPGAAAGLNGQAADSHVGERELAGSRTTSTQPAQ